MYAVVNSGGKQAKVEKGSIIAVERLDAEVGATVSLPVLFIADGDSIRATAEDLAGATVTVEVLEHFKGEKKIVFKFKKRKGYKRTKGHRQTLTSVRVVDISVAGVPAAKPKAEKAEKPKAEKPAAPVEKAEKPKAEKPAAPVEKAEKPKAEKPAAPVEKAEKPKAEKPAPEPVAEPAAPVAGDGQCAAVKSDGTRCANKAKEGSQYCGVHAKKYDG